MADEASLERIVEVRLDRANRRLQDLLAISGKGSDDFDMAELRPYLAYERVRDGLFQIARSMYGFDFVRVTDVPIWHA